MKMKTNRKVKKLFSYVLTAAMVITAVTPAFAGKVKAVAAGLTLTEQSGWLESAYVEWQPVKNAEGYVAYVKEASASDDAYEKLDDTVNPSVRRLLESRCTRFKRGQLCDEGNSRIKGWKDGF